MSGQNTECRAEERVSQTVLMRRRSAAAHCAVRLRRVDLNADNQIASRVVDSTHVSVVGTFIASTKLASMGRLPFPSSSSSDQHSNNTKTTFAHKLSRAVADLTAGSHDRLAKWKSKLSGQREPTAIVENDIVEWNPEPTAIRPLHSTRSATNAFAPDLIQTDNLPFPLHKSSSVRDTTATDDDPMEHRTLRPRWSRPLSPTDFGDRSRAPMTFGRSSGDISIDRLPPPARITPFSGIKPQDNGIARPIAFRPLTSRSSTSPESFDRPNVRENSRSIGNLNSLSASSRPIPQQPPNGQLFAGKSIGSLPAAIESNYDTVAEYAAEKKNDYSTLFASRGVKVTTLNSRKNTQRQSNGVQITPSPSDSGIVDYETLIRDKENELCSVRHAMEQNEEVLIRVYQEKERQFKEQMTEIQRKLQTAQRGEQQLRQQLRQSDEQKLQLERIVKNLTDEKNHIHRRSVQIEAELQKLRSQPLKCDECRSSAKSANVSMKPLAASKEPTTSVDIRGDVEELRGEVSSLRDQLNRQIHFLVEERRRWAEPERGDVSPSANNNESPPKSTHFSTLQRNRQIVGTDRLI